MTGGKKGTLIIIRGSEDKIGNKAILEEVARFIGAGKLAVTAIASEEQRRPSEQKADSGPESKPKAKG
jgi:cyanophycinase